MARHIYEERAALVLSAHTELFGTRKTLPAVGACPLRKAVFFLGAFLCAILLTMTGWPLSDCAAWAETPNTAPPASVPASASSEKSEGNPAPAAQGDAASLTSSPTPGASVGPDAQKKPPFAPSENLHFEVSYLGLPVGELDMTVASPMRREGVETWPLVGSAKTSAAFVFYPVRDKYVSWFNPATGLSMANELRADENHQIRRERVTFDRTNNRAIFRRDGGNKPRVEKTLEIPPEAQDLLAMIYRVRMADLNVGDVIESPICTGQRAFMMRATIRGTEKVTVKAGTFETRVAYVEVDFKGQLASKREVRMFFTNDARHIPVKVDAEFFLGRLTAELTSWSSGL